MRAIVKMLYDDGPEVTMTITQVETPDTAGQTFGMFLSAFVTSAVLNERSVLITVDLSPDQEDD